MPDDQTIRPAMTAEQWEKRAPVILDYTRSFFGIDGLHPVAASCLYQQPFGFTQEDVAALEREGNELCAFASDEDDPPAMVARGFALLNLAKRIAALLPPSP